MTCWMKLGRSLNLYSLAIGFLLSLLGSIVLFLGQLGSFAGEYHCSAYEDAIVGYWCFLRSPLCLWNRHLTHWNGFRYWRTFGYCYSISHIAKANSIVYNDSSLGNWSLYAHFTSDFPSWLWFDKTIDVQTCSYSGLNRLPGVYRPGFRGCFCPP